MTGILFCLQINKAESPCKVPQPPTLRQEAADSHNVEHQPSFMQPEARGHPFIGNIGAEPPTDGPLQPTTGKETGPAPLCQNKEALHKKSYIDDLTLLEKISLAKLKKKQRIVGPLNWHNSFNLTLPPNQFILQHQLDDLVHFTKE